MNGKLAPTPDNISEADFEPQHVTRVVRCPRCQQFFSTARRWQLACPECGYEWEEENHFDPSEISAEDLMESRRWDSCGWSSAVLSCSFWAWVLRSLSCSSAKVLPEEHLLWAS